MTSRHAAPADIEGALAELGIDVWRSTDDEVTAPCPGHLKRLGREERHPSWSVNRVSGLHNCYSCGFKGTFLDLVMELLFPNDVFRAARWLRQYGVNLARAADLVSFSETTEREVEQAPLVPETRLAMYAAVPDWALEARQLDRESVELHGVRWNEKNDSWIVPVRLPDGDLLGWQEKYERKRRFMNRPREMKKSLTLFGLGVFPVGEPAVLLESPLDVCRLHAAGFEGGLATFGSEVSRPQLEQLVAVTNELVIALDDDKAGHKAAQALIEWGPLTRQLHVRFFDYGSTGEKDVGGMSDADIARGLYESRHWTVAVKKEKRVRRDVAALPGARRQAYGRPGAVPPGRRRGHGQDTHDHRRRRGAA